MLFILCFCTKYNLMAIIRSPGNFTSKGILLIIKAKRKQKHPYSYSLQHDECIKANVTKARTNE